MLHYRNRPWFPLLSLLILGVFIQAQAAGCCKIGAWFHTASKPSSASGSTSAVSAGNLEHACCPKPSAEDGLPAADASGSRVFAGSMARTCCLQKTDLNAAEIVSIHIGCSSDVALPNFFRVLESHPSPRSETFATSAFLDSGPPASRSDLPLLI